MRKTIVPVLTLSLILAGAPQAYAYGASVSIDGANAGQSPIPENLTPRLALETIDITNAGPSPIPGQLLARLIPRKWDSRCIPVPFKVNDTLDPIPNPLGPVFLSVAAATTALQEALDAWNNIPTCFIDMRIIGTVSNPGFSGFDFINEATFRDNDEFGLARAPSVTLIKNSDLAEGDDIDEDGDSDVSSAIKQIADVDNDGDFEFPAGFYRAGTLLDSDVIFNAHPVNGLRFTVNPADADTEGASVDLIALATHEFGHCFGIGHTAVNQLSATDGSNPTMGGIDLFDPASELSQRTLEVDDKGVASFFYPEGSSASGPGALQSGDVAFSAVYGLITGEVRHGALDQPMAGGHLFAIDRNTGVVAASSFSGTTQMSFDPATGALSLLPNVSQAILGGRYVMPVPRGNYYVGIEAVDGFPFSANIMGFTSRVGAFFGQQNLLEEFFNGNEEDVVEREPGDAKNIHVNPGQIYAGVDINTNRVFTISNFGPQGFCCANYCCAELAPGDLIATAISASKLADAFSKAGARNRGHDALIQAALFNTAPLDLSVPVVFAEAMLTTGVINPNNTAMVDLEHPLERVAPFIAQDHDFAPFYFKNPQELGRKVRRGIESGEIQNLFLVLRVPTSTPFPGAAGSPPMFGFSRLPPGVRFGQTFAANPDGAMFFHLRLEAQFSLVIGEPAN
jgi:hypothetical protein